MAQRGVMVSSTKRGSRNRTFYPYGAAVPTSIQMAHMKKFADFSFLCTLNWRGKLRTVLLMPNGEMYYNDPDVIGFGRFPFFKSRSVHLRKRVEDTQTRWHMYMEDEKKEGGYFSPATVKRVPRDLYPYPMFPTGQGLWVEHLGK